VSEERSLEKKRFFCG